MRIAQIIPCLGRNSGGPSRSVYEMNKGLRLIGEDSVILTQNYLDNPNIASDEWIHSIDVKKILPFEYNPRFKDLLMSSCCDLYHIHSIYNYPVTIAARFAKKRDIPYIIAPRGSLYGAAIGSSSSMQKKIFNRLFLFHDLAHASVIHATCKEEMEQIRALGINKPIAVIPNSVSLPQEMPTVKCPSKFRLCFLGRINPIKNIDGLLRAWVYAGMHNRNDAELVIIGQAKLGKEKEYLSELHQLEHDLNISNISWKGSLTGKEKDDTLNSCSFLILPSFSENFGMVVVEALIQGVPVVASKGTPWKELNSVGCGYWINNNVEEMGEQIKQLFSIMPEERIEMGRNGQLYVGKNFSTSSVCDSLKRLYGWIMRKGEKPQFVFD